MPRFHLLSLFALLVLPSVRANPVARADLTRMPLYGGPLEVTGTFLVTEAGTNSVRVMGTLSGLQPSVTGQWHIHVGTSCAAPGTLFVMPGQATPWPGVTYSSTPEGTALVDMTLERLTLQSVLGRVLMVHMAVTNAALACGPLQLVPSPSPSPISPVPSASPPTCCPWYPCFLPEVPNWDLGVTQNVPTDETCIAICLLNPQCKFWLRRIAAKECFLSSTVPVGFNIDPDVSSGPRCTEVPATATPSPSISSSPSPSASPSPGGPGLIEPSPSPSPLASPEILNGCLMYPNTVPAEGIHQFAVLSGLPWIRVIEDCSRWCSDVERCKFWVWRQSSQRCYLGTKVPTIFKLDADASSGPRCPRDVQCFPLATLPVVQPAGAARRLLEAPAAN